MRRDANRVSTIALKLTSPRPSETGTIRAKTRRTAGSCQSIRTWSRHPRRRSNAPRPRAVAFDKELTEHRDERGGQRLVGEERAKEVRYLECDRERVDTASSAEVVGGDDLAYEPEDARDTCREREDRRRHRE